MVDLRANLTDRAIERLPQSDRGQYVVRDLELRGFLLVVGAKRKTFTVQGEYWQDGRRHYKKVAIGPSHEMTTRDARARARELLGKIAQGELRPPAPAAPAKTDVTLRQAWERYRVAHLERKERSPATIRGYADHVERMLSDWLDLPLRKLGEQPRLVAERHDAITSGSGDAAANGCMRTLRAVYNHARKTCLDLPSDNPTIGVDWNLERRRDTAMGVDDLPRWFSQVGRLRHPIRREFHLFTLLSGSRPGALTQARVEHVDFGRRLLHIPRPKGGAKRAFDIPLSRPMVQCLIRAMRVSRALHPEAATTWVFAADSGSGHIVEHKETRARLSKWGNDLRQSYRTLGQAVGLSEIDMHLLMNHSVPGVNAGYITRAKLLSRHLRVAQERLSALIVSQNAGNADRAWPNIPSRRVGDPAFDPTPPDPRLGKPQDKRSAPSRPPVKQQRRPSSALQSPFARTNQVE